MERLLKDVPMHRRSKSAIAAEKKRKQQAMFQWSAIAVSMPTSEAIADETF
jgi:hypothetical protein